MKLVVDIKEKFGDFALRRELSKLVRQVKMHNFATAKVVGFIFDAIDTDKHKASVDFMNFVREQGLEVHGIGIVETSEQSAALPPQQNTGYISLDSTDWLGKSKSEDVAHFMSIKYDMLLDLSMMDLFVLKYVFALADSSFKITNSGVNAQYADFIIEIDDNTTVENLREQITRYLNAISID